MWISDQTGFFAVFQPPGVEEADLFVGDLHLDVAHHADLAVQVHGAVLITADGDAVRADVPGQPAQVFVPARLLLGQGVGDLPQADLLHQ